MFQFLSLDDFRLEGCVVGVRIDINSPLMQGKVTLNERIKAHAKTIKDLHERGAKIVLLAHQGRKGKPDFISLASHAELLSKHLGFTVRFVPELYSKEVKQTISDLHNGEAVLLENLRFFDDEDQPKKSHNRLVMLNKLFDYYVFDAFSVAHRSQTSVIGMTKVPVLAGRVMEKEIRGLNEIEETPRPHLFLFGGAKPEDLLELMEQALAQEWVDKILLTGIIGEAALRARGYSLGAKDAFLEEHLEEGTLERIKQLLKTYGEYCVLPLDVAYSDGKRRHEVRIDALDQHQEALQTYQIQDVGAQTVAYYGKLLRHAGSVYVKGPAGNFEESAFAQGTKGLFSAIKEGDTFAYMGGGHSVTAAYDLGYASAFDYISLAGGALVKFLSGKDLPGVSMLEQSFDTYEKHHEDFIVVGSNCIDTWVKVEDKWEDIHLGDKVKTEGDMTKSLGGGGVSVSLCLKKLGAKVGYLGKHTQESYNWVHNALSREQVICLESEPSAEPCSKSVLLDTGDNDRVIFTYRGQNAQLRFSDFEMDAFNATNYYFSSLSGESFRTLLKMARRIKKHEEGHTIAYNPSLYLIKTEKKIHELIRLVDVLVLNLEEAQHLTGEESVSSCLLALKEEVAKVVVITDGSRGAYAYDGNREYFQKAEKPKEIVDTTGAGDCFAGTFYFFYAKGYGIKRSLRYAGKNAASVVTRKGAQPGQLHYRELVVSRK